MFDKKELRAKMERDRVSASMLAEILDTTKESIYKWREGTMPRDGQMIKKIEAWLKGELTTEPKKVKATNGVDWKSKYDDLKEKHYDLLEKYTALLEKNN